MRTIEGFKLRKLGNEYILVGESTVASWREAGIIEV